MSCLHVELLLQEEGINILSYTNSRTTKENLRSSALRIMDSHMYMETEVQH